MPLRRLAFGFAALAALFLNQPASAEDVHMPWRAAGLTERQAAAHLLDRFAYGARPGDVDQVVDLGLEHWFVQQLDGDLPDPVVGELLARRPNLGLPATELARLHPEPGRVLRRAVEEGVVDHEQLARGSGAADAGRPGPEQRRQILHWAEEQGFRPQREALADLMIQKLARARYSQNQLHEVLTDFWFNHFNVSLTDNQARIYLWPFERDAIRPHVTGSFRDLLGATARHPAMLLYLDNARSVADENATTTVELRRQGRQGSQRRQSRQRRPGRASGLNENYARELMELHTLGVEGGYDQDDVVAVARAFTGWTVLPPEGLPDRFHRVPERVRRRAGFVIDGPFVFRADAHDAGAKEVLGRRLPAGRGLEDGEDVLDLLATHASTAHHVATKLAVRFVADQPPASLVERLAGVYLASRGDLRTMLIELVESPELWSEDALRQKIKSPFEVAMSALRALDAHPRDPRELLEHIRRMGQPLYAYQAPTGFPDRGEAWVNSGALLQRMNFGLRLATGRIPGVEVDLERLAGDRQPAGPEAALRAWVARLLPERDPEPTVRRLLPVLADLDPGTEISAAADDRLRAQAVGVILGSPEFQRR